MHIISKATSAEAGNDSSAAWIFISPGEGVAEKLISANHLMDSARIESMLMERPIPPQTYSVFCAVRRQRVMVLWRSLATHVDALSVAPPSSCLTTSSEVGRCSFYMSRQTFFYPQVKG
jgi:hypothetical protein